MYLHLSFLKKKKKKKEWNCGNGIATIAKKNLQYFYNRYGDWINLIWLFGTNPKTWREATHSVHLSLQYELDYKSRLVAVEIYTWIHMWLSRLQIWWFYSHAKIISDNYCPSIFMSSFFLGVNYVCTHSLYYILIMFLTF